ncbi:hypothetical protein CIB84_015333 [Bambusicola thoracicus]|uniref:Uncharacterized protein n=1 Tax=Bambusicola thoracicus TaxID=9083 RepID=A0A2P4S9Y2_BAMTH|nr:hypothetical protein CIB84_015333 [Bambusicola thoracicus]
MRITTCKASYLNPTAKTMFPLNAPCCGKCLLLPLLQSRKPEVRKLIAAENLISDGTSRLVVCFSISCCSITLSFSSVQGPPAAMERCAHLLAKVLSWSHKPRAQL